MHGANSCREIWEIRGKPNGTPRVFFAEFCCALAMDGQVSQ
ncbi:hypothetical protein [Desulfosporosinus sp.]|nr:hypothetical protein [Desulfosporosinus sp.]